MQRNLIFLGFLIFLGSTAGYYLYRQSIATPTPTNPLVFGIASGYAPFISTNAEGEYEGFDIDVARAIASTLSKSIAFKDLGSMSPLLLALEQGTVDAVIWGLSITQERLKKFDMVRYQGEVVTSYPLLFWNTIPEGITSLSDMQGKIICVEPGSSQSAVLDTYPNLTILPIEHVDDALFNIQYGKATAAFVEPAIAKKFKTAYPSIQILNIPLSAQDQVQGIGIAFKKNDHSLKKQFEQAVETLQKKGFITIFEKKWGLS